MAGLHGWPARAKPAVVDAPTAPGTHVPPSSPLHLLPGFNPGSTTAITKGVGSFSKVAAAVAVNTTIGEANGSGMAFRV